MRTGDKAVIGEMSEFVSRPSSEESDESEAGESTVCKNFPRCLGWGQTSVLSVRNVSFLEVLCFHLLDRNTSSVRQVMRA